ncbi:MAG: transposase, partial [Acidobacteriota bacterium]|nr:transposase [Acidobacteriota bacterium]
VYFRMLLIGYFERLDSERGICWRCADSLSLRSFLGLGLDESIPDHSSLSRIRTRLSLEVHDAVFRWVLGVLGAHGLIDGKTLGVDATTLEANAALRSIVRRDTGETYEEYLKDLARESGIGTPTRSDLAKLDRKRPKKGSNKEWVNPHDPDAEIMKMKNGATHLSHKAEHAVDMSGAGAVLSVTLHGGAKGDTKSLPDTLEAAQSNLHELSDDPETQDEIHEKQVEKSWQTRAATETNVVRADRRGLPGLHFRARPRHSKVDRQEGRPSRDVCESKTGSW